MSELRSLAESIARRLRDAGFVAYFAGGCVRDALLGKEPKDYDIATSAPPGEVQRLFPGSQDIGAHFGVILVRSGGHSFEVATFRTDGSYRDGRRPETVEFSTPEEDAQRRDFTVNGLFLDPADGRIIDFVGGQADLQNRVLRAIGDPAARFREDHLRLLRAVRFATVLDFEIHPETWSAICTEAESLRHISIERVREEFLKIMIHPRRVHGFDLLDAAGLLPHILPEMEILKGCTQPPEFHPEGDVWVHTRLMLSLLPEEVSAPLVLSVLLHDIAKPATRTVDEDTGRIRFNGHDRVGARMTEEILRRLKCSNELTDATAIAVENHMNFMHVQDMRTAKLKRFMARPTFEDEMALHRVDCLGSHGMLDNYEFLRAKQEEFSREPVIPPRLLNGHDLMTLGYPPGPELGRLLTAVQDAQLESAVTTKEEALAWVRREFPLSQLPENEQVVEHQEKTPETEPDADTGELFILEEPKPPLPPRVHFNPFQQNSRSIELLPREILDHYEVHEWRHALAILRQDFPDEYAEICDVLTRFRLRKTWITVGGGRKSKISEWIDGELGKLGWRPKNFATSITIDDTTLDSPTHEVDCFKNRVALEIEWNNKDPFYDRDLNNFRLLFDLRAISVGVIVTRCDELQSIFAELGRGSSYGASTTHLSKLLPRIEGGAGGGCPLLVFGIKSSLYDADH